MKINEIEAAHLPLVRERPRVQSSLAAPEFMRLIAAKLLSHSGGERSSPSAIRVEPARRPMDKRGEPCRIQAVGTDNIDLPDRPQTMIASSSIAHGLYHFVLSRDLIQKLCNSLKSCSKLLPEVSCRQPTSLLSRPARLF